MHYRHVSLESLQSDKSGEPAVESYVPLRIHFGVGPVLSWLINEAVGNNTNQTGSKNATVSAWAEAAYGVPAKLFKRKIRQGRVLNDVCREMSQSRERIYLDHEYKILHNPQVLMLGFAAVNADRLRALLDATHDIDDEMFANTKIDSHRIIVGIKTPELQSGGQIKIIEALLQAQQRLKENNDVYVDRPQLTAWPEVTPRLPPRMIPPEKGTHHAA